MSDVQSSSVKANFNIPKIRRDGSKDNLRSLNINSRDAQDILSTTSRSYLDSTYSAPWDVKTVKLVDNKELEEKYRTKRSELKEQGRHTRDLQEQFMFVLIRDEKVVAKITQQGLKTKNQSHSALGDNNLGVIVFRHADVQLRLGETWGVDFCYMLVFKVTLGKCKILSTLGATGVEPAPNYDCHIYKSKATAADSHQQQLSKSQVYLYEYNDDCELEDQPRHCLPHAVIKYKRVQSSSSHEAKSSGYSSEKSNLTRTAVKPAEPSTDRPRSLLELVDVKGGGKFTAGNPNFTPLNVLPQRHPSWSSQPEVQPGVVHRSGSGEFQGAVGVLHPGREDPRLHQRTFSGEFEEPGADRHLHSPRTRFDLPSETGDPNIDNSFQRSPRSGRQPSGDNTSPQFTGAIDYPSTYSAWKAQTQGQRRVSDDEVSSLMSANSNLRDPRLSNKNTCNTNVVDMEIDDDEEDSKVQGEENPGGNVKCKKKTKTQISLAAYKARKKQKDEEEALNIQKEESVTPVSEKSPTFGQSVIDPQVLRKADVDISKLENILQTMKSAEISSGDDTSVTALSINNTTVSNTSPVSSTSADLPGVTSSVAAVPSVSVTTLGSPAVSAVQNPEVNPQLVEIIEKFESIPDVNVHLKNLNVTNLKQILQSCTNVSPTVGTSDSGQKNLSPGPAQGVQSQDRVTNSQQFAGYNTPQTHSKSSTGLWYDNSQQSGDTQQNTGYTTPINHSDRRTVELYGQKQKNSVQRTENIGHFADTDLRISTPPEPVNRLTTNSTGDTDLRAFVTNNSNSGARNIFSTVNQITDTDLRMKPVSLNHPLAPYNDHFGPHVGDMKDVDMRIQHSGQSNVKNSNYTMSAESTEHLQDVDMRIAPNKSPSALFKAKLSAVGSPSRHAALTFKSDSKKAKTFQDMSPGVSDNDCRDLSFLDHVKSDKEYFSESFKHVGIPGLSPPTETNDAEESKLNAEGIVKTGTITSDKIQDDPHEDASPVADSSKIPEPDESSGKQRVYESCSADSSPVKSFNEYTKLSHKQLKAFIESQSQMMKLIQGNSKNDGEQVQNSKDEEMLANSGTQKGKMESSHCRQSEQRLSDNMVSCKSNTGKTKTRKKVNRDMIGYKKRRRRKKKKGCGKSDTSSDRTGDVEIDSIISGDSSEFLEYADILSDRSWVTPTPSECAESHFQSPYVAQSLSLYGMTHWSQALKRPDFQPVVVITNIRKRKIPDEDLENSWNYERRDCPEIKTIKPNNSRSDLSLSDADDMFPQQKEDRVKQWIKVAKKKIKLTLKPSKNDKKEVDEKMDSELNPNITQLCSSVLNQDVTDAPSTSKDISEILEASINELNAGTPSSQNYTSQQLDQSQTFAASEKPSTHDDLCPKASAEIKQPSVSVATPPVVHLSVAAQASSSTQPSVQAQSITSAVSTTCSVTTFQHTQPYQPPDANNPPPHVQATLGVPPLLQVIPGHPPRPVGPVSADQHQYPYCVQQAPGNPALVRPNVHNGTVIPGYQHPFGTAQPHPNPGQLPSGHPSYSHGQMIPPPQNSGQAISMNRALPPHQSHLDQANLARTQVSAAPIYSARPPYPVPVSTTMPPYPAPVIGPITASAQAYSNPCQISAPRPTGPDVRPAYPPTVPVPQSTVGSAVRPIPDVIQRPGYPPVIPVQPSPMRHPARPGVDLAVRPVYPPPPQVSSSAVVARPTCDTSLRPRLPPSTITSPARPGVKLAVRPVYPPPPQVSSSAVGARPTCDTSLRPRLPPSTITSPARPGVDLAVRPVYPPPHQTSSSAVVALPTCDTSVRPRLPPSTVASPARPPHPIPRLETPRLVVPTVVQSSPYRQMAPQPQPGQVALPNLNIPPPQINSSHPSTPRALVTPTLVQPMQQLQVPPLRSPITPDTRHQFPNWPQQTRPNIALSAGVQRPTLTQTTTQIPTLVNRKAVQPSQPYPVPQPTFYHPPPPGIHGRNLVACPPVTGTQPYGTQPGLSPVPQAQTSYPPQQPTPYPPLQTNQVFNQPQTINPTPGPGSGSKRSSDVMDWFTDKLTPKKPAQDSGGYDSAPGNKLPSTPSSAHDLISIAFNNVSQGANLNTPSQTGHFLGDSSQHMCAGTPLSSSQGILSLNTPSTNTISTIQQEDPKFKSDSNIDTVKKETTEIVEPCKDKPKDIKGTHLHDSQGKLDVIISVRDSDRSVSPQIETFDKEAPDMLPGNGTLQKTSNDTHIYEPNTMSDGVTRTDCFTISDNQKSEEQISNVELSKGNVSISVASPVQSDMSNLCDQDFTADDKKTDYSGNKTSECSIEVGKAKESAVFETSPENDKSCKEMESKAIVAQDEKENMPLKETKESNIPFTTTNPEFISVIVTPSASGVLRSKGEDENSQENMDTEMSNFGTLESKDNVTKPTHKEVQQTQVTREKATTDISDSANNREYLDEKKRSKSVGQELGRRASSVESYDISTSSSLGSKSKPWEKEFKRRAASEEKSESVKLRTHSSNGNSKKHVSIESVYDMKTGAWVDIEKVEIRDRELPSSSDRAGRGNWSDGDKSDQYYSDTDNEVFDSRTGAWVDSKASSTGESESDTNDRRKSETESGNKYKTDSIKETQVYDSKTGAWVQKSKTKTASRDTASPNNNSDTVAGKETNIYVDTKTASETKWNSSTYRPRTGSWSSASNKKVDCAKESKSKDSGNKVDDLSSSSSPDVNSRKSTLSSKKVASDKSRNTTRTLKLVHDNRLKTLSTAGKSNKVYSNDNFFRSESPKQSVTNSTDTRLSATNNSSASESETLQSPRDDEGSRVDKYRDRTDIQKTKLSTNRDSAYKNSVRDRSPKAHISPKVSRNDDSSRGQQRDEWSKDRRQSDSPRYHERDQPSRNERRDISPRLRRRNSSPSDQKRDRSPRERQDNYSKTYRQDSSHSRRNSSPRDQRRNSSPRDQRRNSSPRRDYRIKKRDSSPRSSSYSRERSPHRYTKESSHRRPHSPRYEAERDRNRDIPKSASSRAVSSRDSSPRGQYKDKSLEYKTIEKHKQGISPRHSGCYYQRKYYSPEREETKDGSCKDSTVPSFKTQSLVQYPLFDLHTRRYSEKDHISNRSPRVFQESYGEYDGDKTMNYQGRQMENPIGHHPAQIDEVRPAVNERFNLNDTPPVQDSATSLAIKMEVDPKNAAPSQSLWHDARLDTKEALSIQTTESEIEDTQSPYSPQSPLESPPDIEVCQLPQGERIMEGFSFTVRDSRSSSRESSLYRQIPIPLNETLRRAASSSREGSLDRSRRTLKSSIREDLDEHSLEFLAKTKEQLTKALAKLSNQTNSDSDNESLTGRTITTDIRSVDKGRSGAGYSPLFKKTMEDKLYRQKDSYKENRDIEHARRSQIDDCEDVSSDSDLDKAYENVSDSEDSPPKKSEILTKDRDVMNIRIVKGVKDSDDRRIVITSKEENNNSRHHMRNQGNRHCHKTQEYLDRNLTDQSTRQSYTTKRPTGTDPGNMWTQILNISDSNQELTRSPKKKIDPGVSKNQTFTELLEETKTKIESIKQAAMGTVTQQSKTLKQWVIGEMHLDENIFQELQKHISVDVDAEIGDLSIQKRKTLKAKLKSEVTDALREIHPYREMSGDRPVGQGSGEMNEYDITAHQVSTYQEANSANVNLPFSKIELNEELKLVILAIEKLWKEPPQADSKIPVELEEFCLSAGITPSEMEMNRNLSCASTTVIRQDLQQLESEIKNRISKFEYHGKSNSRLPSELLFRSEIKSHYSDEGLFLYLCTPMPEKPYKKLLAIKEKYDASTSTGEKKQLHTVRRQVMCTFTGGVSKKRLNKLRVKEKFYHRCYNYLHKQYGIETAYRFPYLKMSRDDLVEHISLMITLLAVDKGDAELEEEERKKEKARQQRQKVLQGLMVEIRKVDDRLSSAYHCCGNTSKLPKSVEIIVRHVNQRVNMVDTYLNAEDQPSDEATNSGAVGSLRATLKVCLKAYDFVKKKIDEIKKQMPKKGLPDTARKS